MRTRQHLEGLIAAPFTPMREDGGVNIETIEPYARLLAGNGVRGVFVCGTTGEGLSLSGDERTAVASCWREAAADQLAVIVNVAHNSLPDACALADHAQGIGADAIGTFGPIYHRPADVGALVAWCAQIAAAAPQLPFYYYHIPSMTNLPFKVADILRAGAPRIPTLAGAKFTYEDLSDFSQCVALDGGRFDMLFGRDEILLAGLAAGARGAVGTTYNFAAPLYLGLIEAYKAGEMAMARARQLQAQAMIDTARGAGGLGAFKAMMKMIGLDCGPTRPPLRAPSARQCQALRQELTEIGFFDFCCRVIT